jgi:hypothetical protein
MLRRHSEADEYELDVLIMRRVVIVVVVVAVVSAVAVLTAVAVVAARLRRSAFVR